MGMFKKNCSLSDYAIPNSNPDPSKFNIISSASVNGALIVHVNYPGCKNFEGDKILVYMGFNSIGEILHFTNNELDPHFANNSISPIARFKPTKEGMNLAIKLSKILGEEKIKLESLTEGLRINSQKETK